VNRTLDTIDINSEDSVTFLTGCGAQFIISVKHADKVKNYRWHRDSHGYIYRHRYIDGKDRPVRLHREIACAPPDKDVDHINGLKTDNREENLRICTRRENVWNTPRKTTNTSGHKGVDYVVDKKKFRARIRIKGKRLNLGYFSSVEEASRAYVEAALVHHGEFSKI
jgi:hypothetical protein